MRSQRTILLTGANGYIGRHLLMAMLEKGHKVIALVRRKNGQLEDRLDAVLKTFGSLWSNHIEVIEADITADGCGLSPAARNNLHTLDIHACVHCAGLTRFDDHLAEEIFEHNMHGVRRVFELCRRLEISHFHHISTSFVAGEYTDIFRESDLDVEQTFRNPYERAKYDAEKYLHKAAVESNICIHIYRPSIVTGGFMLGESNSASTIYTFLKSLHFIRQRCLLDIKKGRGKFASIGVRKDGNDIFIPLRMDASTDATLNLVSIRQVTLVLMADIEQPLERFSVRHIVGNRDFDLEEVRHSFCDVMGIKGTTCVSAEDFLTHPRSSLEQRFYRSTKTYRPYLHSRPLFERRDTPGSSDKEINLSELVTEFLVHIEQKEIAEFSLNPAMVQYKQLNQTASWNREKGVLQ